MPPQLLIMGAPNAGKGTLCDEIRKVYGLIHLSTGDILRAEVAKGTDLGKEVKIIMANGHLVPDDIMVRLIINRIQSDRNIRDRGLLLDGFPRTVKQAEELHHAGMRVDAVICLEISEDKLLERCLGRRIDPVTGTSYHVKFNPPPEQIAKRCVTRADDTADKLKNRLSIYNEQKGGLVKFFSREMITIDAGQSIDSVFAQFHKHMGVIEARANMCDAGTQTMLSIPPRVVLSEEVLKRAGAVVSLTPKL